MPKRLVTHEDLVELKFAGDAQISPDGRSILLTLKQIDQEKNKYWSHLWRVDVRDQKARQFTFGEVVDNSARWSPDGKHVAFLRTKERRAQIWIMPSDGGEARPLTQLAEGDINSLAWSPDGGRLAFCFRPTHPDWTQEAQKKREESGKSNPPRIITRLWYKMDGAGFIDTRQHIWVCDVETGKAAQLTDGDYDEESPAWSPDGRRIAFVSNRSEDPFETPFAMDLWWISSQGGKINKIKTPVGYKGGISWSPDGRWLAYVGHESQEDPWIPRHDRIWIVSPKGGDARCLTKSLDRTVGNQTLSDAREAHTDGVAPLWSGDSAQIYFPISDQGNCHLYGASLREGKPFALTEGALEITSLSVDRPGTTFAMTLAHPTRPTELFVGALRSKRVKPLTLRQLTRFHQPWLDQVKLSEPEELSIQSFDGQKIQGWLLKPLDFTPRRKYPLLLYIHGGPHTQYGHTFFHEFQWHAARGYVVLYTNPRGSMGYSEKFARCIRGDWGNLDYKDLMAAVDHVVKLPYIDKARLAVAGGSYGGYMTNWIIGHTDRFRCAVTDRSVVNMQSMFGTCDFAFSSDGYWKGNPWKNPKKLLQQSPLSYLANVKTPVLIIHSEGDLRCPIEQAEQMFTALKRLKKDVLFVRYPRETSHGLSRGGPPDLRLDRLQRIGDWLDQHLTPTQK
jgi:dipeptidyl aminopeptidase/acylaminoacyl peptidase